MSKPLSIALPPDHVLGGDYKIRITAISPTTGVVVAGVNVSNATMQVESFTDAGLQTPLFSPILIRRGGSV